MQLCSEYRPGCNRPCDADHTATIANTGCKDNKRCCQSGYQFRGDREANYSDSELNTLRTIYRGAIAKFWTVVLGAKMCYH
ncbi:unnamed protein product [Didymodactylos carnosus]|uniref:Uncharacterized protein n=1 Tax=Didymodactylos carnosus TaxID=1234261 RepID=A0A814ZSS7_9BILA|nr:unnamed protein product [Didymodactylos carnosus]CAF4014917.1 unnamed protein product [Didymodactylos carnosus]